MKRPEMIIFDYGHTLLYQPNFNTSNGNKAIYPYINRNPHNISFEEYDKIITELFAKIKAERGAILEIHEHNFLKLAMEYMDISLSVSIEEAEEIIMNGISFRSTTLLLHFHMPQVRILSCSFLHLKRKQNHFQGMMY